MEQRCPSLLPPRDLACGLRVAVTRAVPDQDYLEYRIASTRYLGEGLQRTGIPIVTPPGRHAIYIDAAAILPHIPAGQFPGHAVAVAFYLEGGIRSCELGAPGLPSHFLFASAPCMQHAQTHAGMAGAC